MRVLKALLLERRNNYLKYGQARTHFRKNLMLKTWLGCLQKVNEAKEERNFAGKVRQEFKDKRSFDRAVVVNPIIDKVLPEESPFFGLDNKGSMGESTVEINQRC